MTSSDAHCEAVLGAIGYPQLGHVFKVGLDGQQDQLWGVARAQGQCVQDDDSVPP